MSSAFKKIIPSFIIKYYWQLTLRLKYSRNNFIGKNITFSKDTIIGKNCKIGNNVIFGRNVILANGIKIGSGAVLERIHIGNNSVVEGRVIITGHGNGIITVGKESFIGHNTVLDFSDNITIGDYVHVGYNHFWTHSSAKQCFNGIPLNNKEKKYRPTAPIVIENNAYVGVHSTVYPGITIGHHSIIAPNTAVTKNVSPFSLFGGVPGKLIKQLKLEEKQ